MEEALLWSRESGKIKCELCAHSCLIPEGESGLCNVRFNKNGNLFSKNYGKITKIETQSIEKLPMFHFFPGSKTLSIGSFGCNMGCEFCSNMDLLNGKKVKLEDYTPESVIKLANSKGIKIIAFTYTEPTVNFEFAFKVARLAKRYNIKTVFDTNGYMTSEGIKKIGKYLDAVTVGIKASADPEFYKKYMGVNDVQPIFEALKNFKKHRVFIEITNLVIPEIGGDKELNHNLLDWIINNLESSIPYHLLTFTPSGKMRDLTQTSFEILEKFAFEAKRVGMRYIYIDSPYSEGEYENTVCYNCDNVIVARSGSKVTKIDLKGDRCPSCGYKIDVVVE